MPGIFFFRHRLQRKPLVSDPGMHHGMCVTHVPWCMPGSLTAVEGKMFLVFPAHAQPEILRIWQEAHITKPRDTWSIKYEFPWRPVIPSRCVCRRSPDCAIANMITRAAVWPLAIYLCHGQSGVWKKYIMYLGALTWVIYPYTRKTLGNILVLLFIYVSILRERTIVWSRLCYFY